MALLSCPSTGLLPDWCPQDTDGALPAVLGLLPPGPAWDGAQVAGTVQNTYWRALANLLGYTYSRLCLYVDEFFCRTVNESMDQWIAEYGIGDTCDPYGSNLCAKVAAQGGCTCDYFVSMAAMTGWVITCTDNSTIPEPIAGCFEVGCTSLGPTPVYTGLGSRMGYGQQGGCDYATVVDHPDPTVWDTTKTVGAHCPVPGSNLGQGPDTDESCCFIVGYYDFNPPVVVPTADYCQNVSNTIYFACPRNTLSDDMLPCPTTPDQLKGLDDSGNYSEWGHAYTWEVMVDIAASQAAQGTTPITTPTDTQGTSSSAGCFMVGLPLFSTDGSSPGGTPLCFDNPVGTQATFALCFLQTIAPAHTQLNVGVIQP